MLDTAMAMIDATGLTVSLEHIGFEDVIRDAGVARSAVYRRWPYKDLFFSDLLKAIAATAPAAIGTDGTVAEDAVRRLALDRLDQFRTPEGRRALLVELLRQGALRDFEAMHASPQWRTYIALHATFLSLADGELRTEVQAALATAERGLIDGITRSYEQLAALLGLRLRPELGATFDELAAQVSATMRGFVITARSLPDLAERRPRAGVLGAAEPVEWSQPALGVVAVALSFLEPDPRVEWDEGRIATVRGALEGA
ncbi:hypothetical protein NGF19_22860 [Streptomyces sp. RY43-2]|uniref:HTH tetR-type domain-containing protein n=1 Tax=Streptomyces macrolidinus TaxID=2952607 RepID=A0ABT0ZJ39_9ACTN|nr:hypothetical protein [Streptomyces macrolidinus]MCN9243594.1 hypothetical protein [Streptomyces macrolidinus]